MTTSPIIVGRVPPSGGSHPGPVPPLSGARPGAASSSSIGKASTSVGPFLPKKRSFNAAIVSSSTNSTESSASPSTPSASSTPSAKRANFAQSTLRSACSLATKTSTATARSARVAVDATAFVGGDDVAHDPVADDVGLAEADEAHAVYRSEHFFEPDEAGTAAGDIDLGDVAGDDGPGAKADAGEEHLHLLGRRVLSLVQDDKARVEGTAAHESEGRHFDRAALQQPLGSLRLEHVVEGVVERTQVRVDLGHQVAGQESETLASFDGRASKDYAVHLF